MNIDKNFFARMREATALLQSDGPMAATAAIRRALQPRAAPVAPAPTHSLLNDSFKSVEPQREIIDAEFSAVTDAVKVGRFLSASCTNRAGTRAYKIYIPSGYRGQALPMVVMLHGCKQNPDDFAAGTRMNAFAEQNNFFVAYPEQTQAANMSGCWNWFKPGDQKRNLGEPSIIAEICRTLIRDYEMDADRVYVAGLSAGGAMAAIMGDTYPELFAAIGLHSGLPYGAANDVPSALMAMKNGAHGAQKGRNSNQKTCIPIIIFHGDLDTTVHIRNAEQALAQFASAAGGNGVKVKTEAFGFDSANGHHGYTKTIQSTEDGKNLTELWIIQNAGHAWSGGSSEGSFTDAKGPDASQAIVNFFFKHIKSTANH